MSTPCLPCMSETVICVLVFERSAVESACWISRYGVTELLWYCSEKKKYYCYISHVNVISCCSSRVKVDFHKVFITGVTILIHYLKRLMMKSSVLTTSNQVGYKTATAITTKDLFSNFSETIFCVLWSHVLLYAECACPVSFRNIWCRDVWTVKYTLLL